MTAEEAFENKYKQQMRLLAKTLLELNLSIETIYRILLDKGICTDKDIEETREELLKSDDGFRESFETIDISENINEIMNKQEG